MLCTKRISIKDLNTRKDPSLQAVVAAAAVAVAVVVIEWKLNCKCYSHVTNLLVLILIFNHVFA